MLKPVYLPQCLCSQEGNHSCLSSVGVERIYSQSLLCSGNEWENHVRSPCLMPVLQCSFPLRWCCEAMSTTCTLLHSEPSLQSDSGDCQTSHMVLPSLTLMWNPKSDLGMHYSSFVTAIACWSGCSLSWSARHLCKLTAAGTQHKQTAQVHLSWAFGSSSQLACSQTMRLQWCCTHSSQKLHSQHAWHVTEKDLAHS